MEDQISKKKLWNVDLLRFSPWKSAVEKTTHRFHSWILLTENYLRIRKKINLEHKSLIYQRKNLTNIPSKQFYISWCFHFLDMWHFWPNGSCSQIVQNSKHWPRCFKHFLTFVKGFKGMYLLVLMSSIWFFKKFSL